MKNYDKTLSRVIEQSIKAISSITENNLKGQGIDTDGNYFVDEFGNDVVKGIIKKLMQIEDMDIDDIKEIDREIFLEEMEKTSTPSHPDAENYKEGEEL